MKKTNRLIWMLCAGILLLSAASASLLDCYGRQSRSYAGPAYALADPSRVPATVVETSDALYRLYRSRSVRGRILLHIGRYLQAIDVNTVSLIPTDRYPATVPPMLPLYEKSLSYRNIFWIAGQANIVREIVYFQPPGMFRARLATVDEHEPDVLSKGAHSIVLQDWGSRRIITDLLPHVQVPVLLHIDASVFEELQPAQLLNTLRASSLTADVVTLNLSLDNPDISERSRRSLRAFARNFAKEGPH